MNAERPTAELGTSLTTYDLHSTLGAIHTWNRGTHNEKMDSFKNLRPGPEKHHRETPWLSEWLLMQTLKYPKPPVSQAKTLLEKYSTHQISYEADALNA